MRTTLVINLTRLGDLIQTQPVISGYKRQGDHVVLLCLEQFAKAAALLADVDRVLVLPGSRLLARLDTQWTEALDELYAFLGSEEHRHPLRVINLTPSLSSRLLGHLYAPQGQYGFGLDDHGFGLYSSPWANFLQAASRLRGCSPFNLVDVMVRVAHLPCTGDPPRLKQPLPAIDAWSRDRLGEQAPPDCKGFVAFQLGASQDVRRWPVEYFASLGDHIWKRHGFCPVLVGAASEHHLARGYASLTQAPLISMVGRTDLAQLAGILCQTSLLVTNDTGTMHMAAGLHLPILAIFLATAQPWDTGPYQENALCLEPDMACHPCAFSATCDHDHACRKAISPLVVGELVDGFLATGTWNIPPNTRVRAWKTQRRQGMMNLLALTRTQDDRTSWVRIQQWYYRHFLDRTPLSPLARSFPLTPGVREELVTTLERAQALLHLFREQTLLVTRKPSQAMNRKWMLTWQRIQTLFEQSPWLGILGLVWTYETQDAATYNLDDLVALLDRYENLTQSLCTYIHESTTSNLKPQT